MAWLLLLLVGAVHLSAFGAPDTPAPEPTASSPAPVAPTVTAAAPIPPADAAEATASPTQKRSGRNPLGATPAEIVKLYGPILRRNARVYHHQILEGGTVLDGDLHSSNRLVIRVVYHEGHAVLLEFTRIGGVLALGDVNLLLTATADDSTWVLGKDSTPTHKFYRRSDDRAVANYTSEFDGSLLIAAEGMDHDKLFDNIMR